jgi:single-stranded DNA-specific DHH superfamily exonuclease
VEKAEFLTKELEEVNRRRVSVERETSERVRQEAERLLDPAKDRCLVIGLDDLHIGVIGLAASRLCSAYTRPSLVVSFGKDGVGKGSGRSIAGFDLVAGLRECSEVLEDFGGHNAAAGFSVRREKFEEFRNRFQEVCRKKLSPGDLQPIQRIDAWLELREADRRLMNALERLIGQSADWACLDEFLLSYVIEPSLRTTVLASSFASTSNELQCSSFDCAGRIAAQSSSTAVREPLRTFRMIKMSPRLPSSHRTEIERVG